MKQKRFLALVLFALLMLAVVPSVFAQTSIDLNPDEIMARLGPRSSFPGLLFDLMIYGIFFIGLLTMFLVPDKQLLPQMLMVLVCGLAVFAKVDVFGPTEFPIFIINVGMFVVPFIVAGMVRGKHKTAAAAFPAILTGMLGGGYFFLFWALMQRG